MHVYAPRRMNTFSWKILALIACLLGLSALVVPSGADAESRPPMELESRLNNCVEMLQEMMQAPDGSIPADLIRRCRAIIIFPSVVKAGLGVGGHYGNGVVLRRDPTSGKWGPPVFITLIGGSIGWQVGVQALDLVLLVMNDVSLNSLFRSKITIGADASIAAGPVGREASAATDSALSVGILSYSRAKGLFAGVSVKGSVLEVDWEANELYYESDTNIIDVFFKGKGRISPSAARLIRVLRKYTK